MGTKVGRHAEISTAVGIVPDLLTLGDDTFIADGVMLGDEEHRGGWMVLQPTRIGNRSFVGNGAYVADGAVVPDDVLIGVQTRTPENDQLRSGQTWMGSPPLLLPARERIEGFPESLTFRPSWQRKIGRGLVESLRIVLPLASSSPQATSSCKSWCRSRKTRSGWQWSMPWPWPACSTASVRSCWWRP